MTDSTQNEVFFDCHIDEPTIEAKKMACVDDTSSTCSEEFTLFKNLFIKKRYDGVNNESDATLPGKVITSARYDLIVTFLQTCEDPDKMKEWVSSKKFGNPYQIRKKYQLIGNRLYYQDTSSDRNTLKDARQVAKYKDIFNIIHEKHYGTMSHRCYSVIWNSLKETWWNISEIDCSVFQDLCKHCQTKQPKAKKHKGSVKSIRTSSYRDRFQIDLISYKEQACYDFPDDIELRILYKYILAMRDHFSRFIILRPLQSKSAKLIARELASMFSIIGFPLLLQTDNGSEFIAEEVIQELNMITPYAHTVRGRVRTPRDQGSVERGNRMIKELIDKTVPAMKEDGLANANWVNALPRVMTACNAGRNKGADEASPYEILFGMSYDNPIISANAARFVVGETMNERANRIGGKFKEKMKVLGEFEEKKCEAVLGNCNISQSKAVQQDSKKEAKGADSRSHPRQLV